MHDQPRVTPSWAGHRERGRQPPLASCFRSWAASAAVELPLASPQGRPRCRQLLRPAAAAAAAAAANLMRALPHRCAAAAAMASA